MTPQWRIPGALAVVTVAATAGGCVYLNALYNADRLYGRAEDARLEGRAGAARARYDSVVTKAARAYRKDPDGRWADDALLLLGKAYFRQGDTRRAGEAFRRAIEVGSDSSVIVAATLYLGAVTAEEGDRGRGIELLDQAIGRLMDDTRLRGEGHLLRARALLSQGRIFAAWRDLDRAAEADPRLASAVDLERMVWGIVRNEPRRARIGVERLLDGAPRYVRTDTLVRLLRMAEGRWGPVRAAEIIEPLDDSPWPPDAVDRLRLLRADFRLAAGDTTRARADAREVARGFGSSSVEARLFLARLVFARARTVDDLNDARPVLLPASNAPDVLKVLETVRKVELLRSRSAGSTDPLALFAAAELVRDELNARELARRLFLEYAERAEGRPWAGKALLAALELSDEPDGEPIRRRLAALEANPYVRAARTGWFPAWEFEELESSLRSELRILVTEVTAEAVQLDAVVRERADTL